jgi:hypothetical protein
VDRYEDYCDDGVEDLYTGGNQSTGAGDDGGVYASRKGAKSGEWEKVKENAGKKLRYAEPVISGERSRG